MATYSPGRGHVFVTHSAPRLGPPATMLAASCYCTLGHALFFISVNCSRAGVFRYLKIGAYSCTFLERQIL